MGKPRKILVQTGGSRGDIQPYIAVACAIRDAGYEVCLASNIGYDSFVGEFGIKYYPVFINAESYVREDPIMRKALAEGSTIKFLGGMTDVSKRFTRDHIIEWKQALEDFQPDLIIAGSLTELYARIAAYKLGIPTVELMLQTIPPNPERMVFGFPNLPFCGLNSWMVKNLFYANLWTAWVEADPHIESIMGFKFTEMFTQDMFFKSFSDPDGQPIPRLVAQASLFLDIIWPDRPKMIKCVGQSVIESESQLGHAKAGGQFGDSQIMESLKAFIAAGSRPVFMGWGSMICKSPEYMVELVVRALKHSGMRAVIQGGWARLDMETLKRATKDGALVSYAEENVIFVEKAPHEWLFPQCACTVHHGGAGTFACAARAGVPTIITPIWLDQYDHAYLVNKLGFGIGFETQFHGIKAEKLGDAIKKVVGSADMASRARAFSKSLKLDDAPSAVVKYIADFWVEQVESGKFKKDCQEHMKANRPKRRTFAQMLGCICCKS